MFRKLGLIVAISLLSSASAFAAPPACNATSEGTLAYDSDRKIMVFCDGDEWKALGGSFGGGGSGSTVWLDGATSGEIFYNAGNVGIGTNDPSALLSVAYSATSRVDLSGAHLEIGRNEAASPTTGGFIDLKKLIADDTRVRLEFKPDEDGGAGAFGIGTDADGGTYSAVRRLTILGGSGFVAIGPGAPKTRLDVAGTLRIGNGSELCNVADHEGAMRYVGATDAFEMCRNSAIGWEPLGSGSGGSDNLGDHTATQDLAMAGFKVSDTSAVGLKLIAGNAPLGTPGGGSSLPGLASAQVWVGNAGGAATAVAMSGDATLSNAGVLTIGNSAIGSAEIADGTVASADLAGSIALSKLAITGTGTASNFLRGDGSWQAVPAGADDLGNHTATQALNMGSYAITASGGIVLSSASATQARLKQGNFGVMLRNDGTNYYHLLTNSGDADGTWNALRPLTINLSTGSVSIGNGLSVTGTASATTFSGSGASLTALNATQLTSGTVATARLGSGTANGTTFLRGDGSWAVPSGSDNLGNHTATANLAMGGFNISGAGDILFTGVFADVSDIRLKAGVAPISRALDKISALEGISYHMKKDPDRRTEFGFSAQEVQKIYPELVVENEDSEGTLAINYIGLIAPMVEAIKQLKAENETLRNTNETLRSTIEARLDALEGKQARE